MSDTMQMESLNLTELDVKLIEGAITMNSGQSKYQTEHFVANSQLTPYRMLKQCLLELEARHHSWVNVKNKTKRKKIEIKIAEREMNDTQDELTKELIACDIEEMLNDIRIWERKTIQAEEEINDYLDLAKKIAADDPTLIEKAFTYDHEEERKYWVTRMAKQAAMDMVAYGRIGSGNMDSIAMMPEEDQIMTLATTIQYNERLMGGLSSIGAAVGEGLLQNKEHLPKFDVPKITDEILADINDVQHSTQSKTQSESI
jgi:hypothetical protein